MEMSGSATGGWGIERNNKQVSIVRHLVATTTGRSTRSATSATAGSLTMLTVHVATLVCLLATVGDAAATATDSTSTTARASATAAGAGGPCALLLLGNIGDGQGGLVPDVLGVEGLGGQGHEDGGDLALDLEGLLGLDRLVLVAHNLGRDVGDLVHASDAALHDLGDVDGVEDGSAHGADLDGVELLLLLGAGQQGDGVGDVVALAVVGDDADLVLGGGGLGVLGGLVAHAAVLLAVDTGGHGVTVRFIASLFFVKC